MLGENTEWDYTGSPKLTPLETPHSSSTTVPGKFTRSSGTVPGPSIPELSRNCYSSSIPFFGSMLVIMWGTFCGSVGDYVCPVWEVFGPCGEDSFGVRGVLFLVFWNDFCDHVGYYL